MAQRIPWRHIHRLFGELNHSDRRNRSVLAFPSTRNVTIAVIPDAYWYTSLIAVVIFLGQIATSERYPKVYRLFLWPDAFYTGRGVQLALQTALTILAGAVVGDNQYAQFAGVIISWPVGLFFGYYVAKWGEILLFGKRRKLRGTSNTKEK
ncbi:MAG: hypothetical protein HC828_09940 [Blastochloris sp.]|nr:hypothetical protein [Blastochloris sp.]